MLHDDQPTLSTDHVMHWPDDRPNIPGFLRDCIAHGAEQGPYFDAASFYHDVVEAAEHALRTNTDTKMDDVRDAWMNGDQS